MITHVWSVLCERSIVDSNTNNVMLLVLEQIKIRAGIPQAGKGKFMLPLKVQLVSLWTRDPAIDDSSFEYRMRINDPEGKVVAKADGVTKFGNKSRLRSFAGIEGMPFKKDGNGTYTFVVDYKNKGKWKNVANVPLELEVEFTADPSDTPSK